ncbi:MAG: glycoside hydrolase family 9 protein [Flavisolibacter sp.]
MSYFKKLAIALITFSFLSFFQKPVEEQSWIRINLLGYKPNGIKVAVWCSKNEKAISEFQLVDSTTNKVVYKNAAGRPFGSYGPFTQTYRLNFSKFSQPGKYYLIAGNARSPYFTIGTDVYKGSADFCLRYMRQQRSGYNPFLKDSCHTHDGYTVYGPMPDSTHIDVSGGWHDASDYLQYSATSANATYHLLMAYRDFQKVFLDEKRSNGADGSNGYADVLDEARWGLDWLLKMHPKDDWMFNQIADDRDHISMRIPKEDSQYGRGYERPVYFITGEPQGLFKYKNRTKGTSSTAAKFSSAFALGYILFADKDPIYAENLLKKSVSAAQYQLRKLGVTQTAPGRAPYFYEEENWTDDVELSTAISASAMMFNSKKNRRNLSKQDSVALKTAYALAQEEKITPWLGEDTARHYQWYPFINIGHYELAKQLKGAKRDTIINFYKTGIEKVWKKAIKNAFFRGIPYIWCSNNLTTSFAIQCYWYRNLSKNKSFEELEQANFDWLFGCNPWGTSFIYGLPSWGDTPADPHSAFTHLKNYPIDGGLMDGPVYTSIYNNLIGIQLYHNDDYALFQSNLAVYHDDYGDYSTNEPTMDGTASLIYLLAAYESMQ